ncbi:TPA: mannose-1-phosphate guanylyltransferase/mannose-6-phosphate isomerase, partial [Escherichia coli]|nr:mannose-1-phosphate guanylyltransferase/mannose-6-phosphate isomerase [Escherichia coli]
PLIISNEDHRFLVAEQVRQIRADVSGIILEPVGKNTCPAITLAALHAIQNGDDPYLLILAADHSIGNESEFNISVNNAVKYASADYLVTFGVIPTSPETGYGYIEKGKKIEKNGFFVKSFTEKPDYQTA